ncbi:MAG: hypothetical protein R2941_24445 [Desulfobacterales bacterium]
MKFDLTELTILQAKLKDALKRAQLCLLALDERTRELEAERRENELLRQRLSVLENPKKKETLFIPKTVDINNETWGIQKKSVGNRMYYYAYKRIAGQLHSLSLGRDFDPDEAVQRIKVYKMKKRL